MNEVWANWQSRHEWHEARHASRDGGAGRSHGGSGWSDDYSGWSDDYSGWSGGGWGGRSPRSRHWGSPGHRARRQHWLRAPRRPGPLRRSLDDRFLGGVATGVSRKFGIDPTAVRLAFILGAFMSGFGVALYIGAWLLVPTEGDNRSIAGRAIGDWRGIALALSFVPVLVLVLVVSSLADAGWIGTLATPLCIGAGGFVLLWRNVGDEERKLMGRVVRPLALLGLTARGSWKLVVIRVCIGTLIVAAGVVSLVGFHRAVLRPLGGVFLVVAGAVVVFGPWWLHIARDLLDERQARALAEERADIAARVHDSVLQTLALIQRRADQPQQVVRLARAQERELRSWLFEGHVPGHSDEEDATLATAVQRIQRDVEAFHEVPVEAVVVGDCTLDEDLRSLLEAGREATVNAAKWSRAPVVSLYVEVEPESVSMFVRDRGVGFAKDEVASDRRGVAESIYGRMARHGGKADVRRTPGAGTEVMLKMPRKPGPSPSHNGHNGKDATRDRT